MNQTPISYCTHYLHYHAAEGQPITNYIGPLAAETSQFAEKPMSCSQAWARLSKRLKAMQYIYRAENAHHRDDLQAAAHASNTSRDRRSCNVQRIILMYVGSQGSEYPDCEMLSEKPNKLSMLHVHHGHCAPCKGWHQQASKLKSTAAYMLAAACKGSNVM